MSRKKKKKKKKKKLCIYAVSSGFFLGNELLSALSAQHVFFSFLQS
jgi:hypothetical protein